MLLAGEQLIPSELLVLPVVREAAKCGEIRHMQAHVPAPRHCEYICSHQDTHRDETVFFFLVRHVFFARGPSPVARASILVFCYSFCLIRFDPF